MLFVLSPAKTLDFDSPTPAAIKPSKPAFVAQSAQLVEVLRQHSSAELGQLFGVSEAIATLNHQRFAKWSPRFGPTNSRPAVLAFNGDVYEGLDAKSLSTGQLQWAQQHVAILSGLYGVLAPLDWMQPYRLEMGTALANGQGRNLYRFWGDAIAKHLNERQANEAKPVVVNLASQEYFKAVDRKALRARVVQCVFEDFKGGKYKVISFLAKRARGLMVRFAVTKKITTVAGLQGFNLEGYAFVPHASDDDTLVFRRQARP